MRSGTRRRDLDRLADVWICALRNRDHRVAGRCVHSGGVRLSHRVPVVGVGWAAGVGRLGGILSAFSSGLLLSRFGGAGFFVAIAIVIAVR